MNKCMTTRISQYLLLVAVSVSLLSGCFHDDDETAPAVVTPNGFYEGSATVDNAAVEITDLKGMVSGNRFMFVSAGEVLLYDGTITAINGTAYTATVTVYQHGVQLTTASVTGTFTTGSSLSGTFTDTNISNGMGNGSFTLTYSLNNSASALVRVAKEWYGRDAYSRLNGALTDVNNMTISMTGQLSRDFNYQSNMPALAGCALDAGSTVLPITGINVYTVSLTLSSCTNAAVSGSYTGFATTRTVADDELVIAFSNGEFSGSGVITVN